MGGLGDAGLLAFSPVECLVGGMFIGVSVAARVFVVGHVTGISGIVCNALRHFHSIDKVRNAFCHTAEIICTTNVVE